MPSRRKVLFIAVPLLVLIGLGGAIGWIAYSFGWIAYSLLPPPDDLVTPTQLASIPLPEEPGLLAWSADGKYLAAGTGYTMGQREIDKPAKVFVIDVGKHSVTATVETAS